MSTETKLSGSTSTAPSRKSFCLIRILGRDSQCVDKCPENEIRALKRLCIANIYSATFVTAGIASAMTLADVGLPWSLAIGLGIGAGIFLYDIAYAEKASNDATNALVHGQKDGLKSRVLGSLSAIPRFALAIASALFVSTLALQIPFGADAEAKRSLTEKQANRTLVDKYQLVVDNEERMRVDAAEIESKTESDNNSAKAWLTQNLLSAREDVLHWDLVADCEKFGVSANKGCPEDVSGVPGTQRKYNYAIERRNSQSALITQYQSELEEYSMGGSTAARRELENWRDNNSDRALKMAKSDPDYIESPDSLLYQIESLHRLTMENTMIFVIVICLEVLLIAFDTMGLLIAGWKSSSPGHYEYMKFNEILERESSLVEMRALQRLKNLKLSDEIEKYEHDIALRRFAREQWHKSWQDSAGGAEEPKSSPIH